MGFWEIIALIVLIAIPTGAGRASDPSAGLTSAGRQQGRELDCVRMSQEQAHALYPGQVPEGEVRAGALTDIDALICSRRILHLDERPPRDEAILSRLGAAVHELTQAASASGAPGALWHVDAYYPDPRVAAKIAVAAKTDLAERGSRVSDAVPLLAAGDLAVLRTLPPRDAYPLACARAYAEKSLGDTDAFLGIMLLDPAETDLHAGVCVGGVWRWVR